MLFLFFTLFLLHLQLTPIHGLSGAQLAATLPNHAGSGTVLIDCGYVKYNLQYCTGALISEQIVLTSMMCTEYSSPIGSTRVIVGSYTPFETGHTYWGVARRGVGSGPTRLMNFMLIKLDRPVTITPDVMPYALPGPRDDIDTTTQFYDIFGFGSTDLMAPPEVMPNADFRVNPNYELMRIEMAQLREHPESVCEKYYKKPGPSDLKFRCIGSLTHFDWRVMEYDNGAPLVGRTDRVVYAVACAALQFIYVSSNGPYYQIPVPTYYMDVKHSVPQILDAMKYLMNDTVN